MTEDTKDTEALLVPDAEALAPSEALQDQDTYHTQLDRWGALAASGALPAHVKTPQQAIAIAAMGSEFGWGPMRSLRSIYLVNGNPTLSAQAMLALIYERQPGAEIVILQNDGSTARIKARRAAADAFSEFAFSEKEARKAGLFSKPGQVWNRYTADMLWARCVSRMARRLFPDVIQGAYVVGELEGVEDAPRKPASGDASEAASAVLLGKVEQLEESPAEPDPDADTAPIDVEIEGDA